jgi:O-methyltransferase involved in polyketide biosynthesis
MEKVQVDLGPVQQTLLLPLWGRAVESARKRPRLVDRTAEQVTSRIDYDFRTIAHKMSEISRLAWIARSLVFDSVIRGFLGRNESATVVNIGCGFDTTFERVDNGTVEWIDLDLPDVVQLRRQFIPEAPRRRLIAASIFDRGWEAEIPRTAPVLFLGAGVFYYFTEDQMKSLLRRLVDVFPGCEFAFDIASPMGVNVANKRVIKAGGMSAQATLKWAIESARDMEGWDPRIHVIFEQPMFHEFPKGLNLASRLGMALSDRYRIMSNVHLRTDR